MANEQESVPGIKDLIQAELNKRSQIQREENLAKVQLEVERQNHVQRHESEVVRNRQFLEDLKIYDYLQEIIDAQQLKGAYVLWWRSFPYSDGTWSCDFGYRETGKGYDSSKGPYLYAKEPCLTRVSLVWGISSTKSTFTTPEKRNGIGPGSLISGGGAQSVKTGCKFQSVDVDGSAEAQKLFFRRPPSFKEEPIFDNQMGYSRSVIEPRRIVDRGGYRFPLAYRYAEKICIPSSPIVLSGDQLTPSSIKHALVSNYFAGGHFKELDYREFEDKQFWPFDRRVPEIETK